MLDQISNNKRITDGVTLALLLLAIFLLAVTITEVKDWFNNSGEYPAKTINVNGTAEVKAIPDIATFSFSVVESGDTVESAQEKATEKINSAIDFLKNQGIAEEDIKTDSYNFYPKYEQRPVCNGFNCPPYEQKISGYEVSQSMSVKVRETSEAGKIISELGAIGVSNVSSLSFSTDDEDVYKNQARSQAIEDAKEQAEKLAKDLGVDLGDVVSFGENTSFHYYEGYGGDSIQTLNAKAISAPQIPTGENTYTANVWVTFEIG